MSRLARRALCSVIALLLLACAARSGDDSAALLDRFWNEGPIGWARLEEQDDRSTYRIHLTSRHAGQVRNDQSTLTLTLLRRPGCLRLEKVERDGKNEGRMTALVHTENYYFHLNRLKGDSTWRLVNVGEIKQKNDVESLLMPTVGLYWVRPMTSFTGGTHYRFLDFRGNRSIKFDRAQWDGDGIRVHYNAAGRTHVTDKPYETRGSIVFDPTNHWAMRSFEFHRPSDGLRLSVVNNFGQPDRYGIRPIVARREECIGQTGSLVQDFRYEVIETGPAPPERFRLADFGLPDPLGPLPSRFPTAYVLTAAGLACLVIALWFARRIRSQQVAASPGSGA